MAHAPPALQYFRPGQFIFRENDQAHCLYLIKKGTVAVRKRKDAGYIEIGRIYSNEVIGELAFFDHMPRSAAAVALTEVEVLEIPFEAFEKVLGSVPEFARTIIASLAERLRKADDMIRRLERRTLSETDGAEISAGQPSAADVLAATSDVDSVEGAAAPPAADVAATGDEAPAAEKTADDKGGGEKPPAA